LVSRTSLTEEIRYPLSQLFSAVPVCQEESHRREQTPVLTSHFLVLVIHADNLPLKPAEQDSADAKASEVLDESHAHANESPAKGDDGDNSVELQPLDV
jgi:hypothetical protein